MAIPKLFQKTLTIALSDGMYKDIREITDRDRISKGEFVRAALEKHLSNLSKERGKKT